MGKSFNTVTLVSARVAGQPTYTPSYMKAGVEKPISAKCDVNVYQNIMGKKHMFKVTGWGKMADVMARSLSTGKELTIVGRLDSFQGHVWNAPDGTGNRSFKTNPDGTAIMVTKIGITIEKLDLGVDSAKNVIEEINAGKRPLHFAVPGHAEKLQWEQMCAQKNAEQYVAGAVVFGYAKVWTIPGTTPVNNTVANNVGTAQFTANVNSQVVNPANPAPPQVQVNGQNMGYAVQQPGQVVTQVANQPIVA
jgi:single-stranded DNA-binding protein